MKRRNKFVALVMAAGMICGLLAGCGDTSADQASDKGGKTGTGDTSGDEAKEVTLTFLGFKTGAEEGALPDIISQFEEAHPGVTVEYEAIPTTANYVDVLSARMATNEGPDVFMIHDGEFETMVDVGYVEELSSEAWADTILDEFTTALAYQSKQYVLPIESSGLGLFVNKTALDKAGAEVPSIWSEFEEACGKVKEAGMTPLIMGNKTGWSAGIFCSVTFESKYGAESDIMTQLVDGDTDYVEQYEPIFEKYEEIIDNEWSNAQASLGMEYDDAAVAEYAKGESAFMIGGTWQIATVQEAMADQEILFIPLPTQDDKVVAKLSAGTCLAVNANSANLELAKEFLAFFADDSVMSQWVQSQSAFTTLKGGTSTDEAGAQIFADAIANGQASIGPKSDDRFKADVWSSILKGVQVLTLQEADAKTAALDLQRDFELGQSLQ